MSTVSQLADRVYSDYLHAPDDQPVILTLDGAVTDSATSWTYDDSTLAPDEEDLIAPGVIIECGSEQARIMDVSADSNTLTVVRGVNGTDAAAHADGDEVVVAPMFARRVVEEAVKDSVVGLYPELWHIATESVTTSTSYVEVPAAVVTPVEFMYSYLDNYIRAPFRLEQNFPPSSTGKAIFLHGSVPDGNTGYFTYRSKFDRPASVSTDVADVGVDESWERIVVVSAAAQVVAGRPQDDLSTEYIVEQLEREAQPPGTAMNIRNGLLTLRSIWLDQARRALLAEHPQPVTYTPLGL